MANKPDGSSHDPVALLARKGLRYATVIDLGCADGHFFVNYFLKGPFRNSVPVNIDANVLYEPSLRDVRDTLGGHYRIAAVSDTAGEANLTESVHPYWSSLRPPGDLYWERVNNLASDTRSVPTIRLDDLADELRLQPPYLLKLDIQGSEVAALRGAANVLSATDVIICEADIADFQEINTEIVGAGFNLFDITALSRIADGSLGWFYPVYVSARVPHVSVRQFWGEASNKSVVRIQADRRRDLVAWLGEVLPRIRAARRP